MLLCESWRERGGIVALRRWLERGTGSSDLNTPCMNVCAVLCCAVCSQLAAARGEMKELREKYLTTIKDLNNALDAAEKAEQRASSAEVETRALQVRAGGGALAAHGRCSSALVSTSGPAVSGRFMGACLLACIQASGAAARHSWPAGGTPCANIMYLPACLPT